MTTPAGGQEAPHFTRQLLLSTLRYLRGDFQATLTGEAPDARAQARLDAARALGLGPPLAEAVLAAMASAETEAEGAAWPGGLEVRYAAVIGALRALAETSSALTPAGVQAARLEGLGPVLAEAERAASSAHRRRLAQRLRGLYVIIDPALTGGRDAAWVAAEALAGGATALQLRVKETDAGDWLLLAQRLAALTREADAVLFVNDHADMTVAAGADGVHLGQHDLPLAAARSVLRPWHLAGTSNALVEEARASLAGGADYIAVGRMFETSSKANTRPAGPARLAEVRALIPADGPPLVAIGGITPANVAEVARAGADGVCVIGAVTGAPDPRAAAAGLLAAFRAGQGA
jgi:thiamine-phosphate pyrophosphorylase